jgi:peptide-methionine (S)-S-oxide reductase
MPITPQATPKFFLPLIWTLGLCLLTYLNLLAESINTEKMTVKTNNNDLIELATLGAGCFWCVEAVFESLKGVEAVISGYTGGQTENPTYETICSGKTGHAEVIQIKFKPSVISFETILERFWDAHDPTTLNRQGADVGTQYRSAIFYHSASQQKTAINSKANAQASFSDKIVTEIVPAQKFYSAEGYHQNFYHNNQTHPYCQFVIRPKLQKLGTLD